MISIDPGQSYKTFWRCQQLRQKKTCSITTSRESITLRGCTPALEVPRGDELGRGLTTWGGRTHPRISQLSFDFHEISILVIIYRRLAYAGTVSRFSAGMVVPAIDAKLWRFNMKTSTVYFGGIREPRRKSTKIFLYEVVGLFGLYRIQIGDNDKHD